MQASRWKDEHVNDGGKWKPKETKAGDGEEVLDFDCGYLREATRYRTRR